MSIVHTGSRIRQYGNRPTWDELHSSPSSAEMQAIAEAICAPLVDEVRHIGQRYDVKPSDVSRWIICRLQDELQDGVFERKERLAILKALGAENISLAGHIERERESEGADNPWARMQGHPPVEHPRATTGRA